MIMSARERKIGMVAAGVILLLAVDRLFLTPYIEKRDRLVSERENLVVEMRRSRKMVAWWKEISAQWEATYSPALVENAGIVTLDSIRIWAEESGISLTLLKPESSGKKGDIEESVFHMVGTGSMKNITVFMWKVESSGLPLKIKEMQLAVRREGTDDLTLQVRIAQLKMPSSAHLQERVSSETSARAEEIR
ncbi:MAG TPA: hypothetical protein PKN36_00750 [bacterium]|nr:hypothetical protein [bacterium]